MFQPVGREHHLHADITGEIRTVTASTKWNSSVQQTQRSEVRWNMATIHPNDLFFRLPLDGSGSNLEIHS